MFPSSPSPVLTQALTILIADWNLTVLDRLAGQLELQGHNLLSATSIVQVIRYLGTIRPDVILLDVEVLDGFEAYRQIRTQYRSVPVIFLTVPGRVYLPCEEQILLGNYILHKPLRSENLLTQLNGLPGLFMKYADGPYLQYLAS
ncbi:MAG: response regulator [Gemmatimonadaceae bacterium]|nr:response regulator [Gloeobacterales cyanobacterium ES-bin-141]